MYVKGGIAAAAAGVLYYMYGLNSNSVVSTNNEVLTSFSDPNLLHGRVGRLPDGSPAFKYGPRPAPATEDELLPQLIAGGGMHVEMSDSVDLDRSVAEVRDPVCLSEKYDIQKLSSLKASVLITFHEEWMSTLLRSIHSVLNRTPPELLHEIVLVDDASTKPWLLEPLEEYLKTLPAKVKLIRNKERKGVVRARLAGAAAATGETMVILDSHIEVSKQWLEPLLETLYNAPKAVVTPQIDSIVSTDFSQTRDEGIGCYLGLKFTMVEEAHVYPPVTSTAPVASPIMAGGLWATRRTWFYELGGYDEQMDIWGAEHLEFSMRIWMCGGQVLCAPCSRVFHVFRRGSEQGYSIPLESIWKNRLRTAAAWMGDFGEIAEAYNHHPGLEVGTMDRQFALQEKLQCQKDFQWYIDNVLKDSDIKSRDDVVGLGEIVALATGPGPKRCLDIRGSQENGAKQVNFYPCYENGPLSGRGRQGFMLLKERQEVRLTHLLVTDHERLCYKPGHAVMDCPRTRAWVFHEVPYQRAYDLLKNVLPEGLGEDTAAVEKRYKFLRMQYGLKIVKCLAINPRDGFLLTVDCDENDPRQLFAVEKFPNHKWRRQRAPWEAPDQVPDYLAQLEYEAAERVVEEDDWE